jgi:SAM-dependent methyltransferase
MGLLRIISLFSHRAVHNPLTRIVNLHYYRKNIEYFRSQHTATDIGRLLGLENKKKSTCVELACGYGWFSRLLCEQFPKVTFLGFDIDTEAIQFAKKAEKFANRTLAVANAEHLPLGENSVDWCVVFNAFEHFEHPEAVCREIYRVLKPGGQVFLSIPNKYGLGHLDSMNLGKVWEYSYFEIEDMAKKFGFDCHILPPDIAGNIGKKLIIALFRYSGLWKIFKAQSFRVIFIKLPVVAC